MSNLVKEYKVAEMLSVSMSWLQKGRIYGYGPRFIALNGPKGAIRYRSEDIENYLHANSSTKPAMSAAEARAIDHPSRRRGNRSELDGPWPKSSIVDPTSSPKK